MFLINVLVTLIVFFLGASLGSFSSAYIYRYERGISIAKGRSFCPSCQREIKNYDLIPVFSYLILKAKCRYCQTKILLGGFLTEVFLGLMALGVFYFYQTLGHRYFSYHTSDYQITAYSFIVIFALAALYCIFMIDLRTMEIPHALNISLLILGLMAGFLTADVSWADRAIGLIIISLPMFLMTLIVKDSFGGGDVKLVAVAGVLLGYKALLAAFFVGLVIGGIQGVYILSVKKGGRKTHFAFGPALTIGIAISLIFGDNIANWYLNLIL